VRERDSVRILAAGLRGRAWAGREERATGGVVRWGWRNTARARRRGLSNPTVQTRKGRASVRATGSMGMLSAIAKGRERTRARTEEDMMAQGSQKLEPRARERTMRR